MTDSVHSEPVAVPRGPSGKAARSFAIHAALAAIMMATQFAVLLPAVLLHCGIRLGRRAAWLVLALSIAFAAIFTAFEVATTSALPRTEYTQLLMVILGLALPTMAVLPMVERGESFGRVALTTVLFAAGGLLLLELGTRALLSFSPYAEQADLFRKTGAVVADAYAKMGAPSWIVTMWTDVAFCTAGLVIINMAFNIILSVVMFGRVRGWRAAIDGGDVSAATPYLFRNLAFPDWLLFGFIAGGVVPLVKGVMQQVGANVLTVVIYLYFVQGLAILRSLLVTFGAGFGMSLLAYATVVLLTPVSFPMLLIAGLFDPFFDFRHFMKRKDDSDESHSD